MLSNKKTELIIASEIFFILQIKIIFYFHLKYILKNKL